MDKQSLCGNAKQSHSGKVRHFHAHFEIFRHIQELFRNTQAYSGSCVTMDYLHSVTLAYSEPWYI